MNLSFVAVIVCNDIFVHVIFLSVDANIHGRGFLLSLLLLITVEENLKGNLKVLKKPK